MVAYKNFFFKNYFQDKNTDIEVILTLQKKKKQGHDITFQIGTMDGSHFNQKMCLSLRTYPSRFCYFIFNSPRDFHVVNLFDWRLKKYFEPK